MIRIALLIAALSCPGCGREPDRPRYVPASEAGSPGTRATGEVLVPHKIEMH